MNSKGHIKGVFREYSGTGQLFLNNHGCLQVDNHELQIGEEISVLVLDGICGVTRWVDTTVQYDDEDCPGYYLSGLLGYNIIGLFAEYSTKAECVI